MPYRQQTGYGYQATPENMLTRAQEGYGWERGCGVTLSGSTSAIDLDVSSGQVTIDTTPVSVAGQTVTLQDGQAEDYRKDVIYVDRAGDAQVEAGRPNARDDDNYDRWAVFEPAIPDTAALDGVPIAAVWVPPETTSAAELGPQDVRDLRVGSAGASGPIPERSSDPSDEQLLSGSSRYWYNKPNDDIRAYLDDGSTQKVVSISKSLVRTISSSTDTSTVTIEDFEDDITGNWRASEFNSGGLETSTNRFAGDGSQKYTADDVGRYWSLKGDGLDYYPDEGDTIRIAIDLSQSDFGYLQFAKGEDSRFKCYTVRADQDSNFFQLWRSDSDDRDVKLAEATPNVPADWVVIEVDYDGGGDGVHPCRLYDVTWSGSNGDGTGSKNTKLADLSSPTSDNTYNGRGVGIVTHHPAWFDQLEADQG